MDKRTLLAIVLSIAVLMLFSYFSPQRPVQRAAKPPEVTEVVTPAKEEVQKNMREAISFHVEGMHQESIRIPQPHSFSAYLEIPA